MFILKGKANCLYFKGGCDKRREHGNIYRLMKLRQKELRDLWQIISTFSEVEGKFICVKQLGKDRVLAVNGGVWGRHIEKIKGDVIKGKKVLI